MSCGCGGMPVSTALRMKALELADRDGVVGQDIVPLAQRYLDFLRGNKTDEQLDTPPRRTVDATSRARNEFLQQPPNVLACDEAIIAKLEKHGVRQIGSLVQWGQHQLRDHAEFTPSEITAVVQELMPHGLRLGLDTDQLRNWILHGTLQDPSRAQQA